MLGPCGYPPEIAARVHFGRSGDWLRQLERDGVIPPAPRSPNGYRVYTPEHVEQIREILARRKAGRA